MSEPTKPTGPSPVDTIAELKSLVERAEKLAAAKTAPATPAAPAEPVVTKGVTQTDEQAIQAEIVKTRDRLAEVEKSAAEREKEFKALEAKILEFQAGRDQPKRRGEMSLEDGVDAMRETLGVAKDQTVAMFRSLSTARNADVAGFERTHGPGRNPLDVLICGTFAVPNRSGIGYKVFAPAADDELMSEVRDLHDGVFVWTQYQNPSSPPDIRNCPLWPRYVAARERLAKQVIGKALDTTDTSNFVPTSFSAELVLGYDTVRTLSKRFRALQVPRFPFDLPGSGAALTVYSPAENTADIPSATVVTTSDPTDRKTNFTRKRIVGSTHASYDLEADSIIPLAQWMRDEIARGLGHGEEQFIVDGDNAASHQDTDTTASDDVRKQVLGLRAHAVDQSFTTSLATFSVENLNTMIQELNEYGSNPTELIWIGAPAERTRLNTIVNAGNFPMVVGAAGVQPAATFNAGMVSNFLGIDYVMMQKFRRNLNSSGFYDGTTGKTGLLLVNTRRWILAYDNIAPTYETMRWPRTQQFEIVVAMRRDFKGVDAATEHNVEYGIAIAV